MSTLTIIIIVIVLMMLLLVFLYNKLTRLRILVREGWSGIGTFLQQRNDLIPNLVETVKGYSLHESSTLTEVVKWRNRSMQAGTPAEQIEATNGMNRALVDFFALAEQYPDLKASQNFINLQNDLTEMETKLNQSRRYYNGTVRNYNQSVATFPGNIVAGIFGFREEVFFEEEPTATAVPKVSFR
ncbi:LemA family protein [Flavihumibacter sp.]|jgi:LemA protein|uniref:LemA family protein n=1 Tax=Flavihumibacter sp. TaxID=1913981 RepID=UPI002FC6EB05|nr:LemA family protein [Flavihumibacter sediminis]